MSENKYEINDYKSAFESFKKRFLEDKKSIFKLNDNTRILTKENVDYLMKNFVNKGYSGDASFEDKLRHQLDLDTKSDSGALEILATAVWLWRLPPSNAKDRESSVKAILKFSSNNYEIAKSNPFFNEFPGFASTGTYYNTNKPFELAYIINFLNEILKDPENSNYLSILKSVNFDGKMTINTIADYSKNKDKPSDFILIKKSDKDKPRTVSIHNALLHLFDNNSYEPILSNDHKEKITKSFSKILDIEDDDVDISISKIKEKLKDLSLDIDPLHFFYDKKIINIWYGGIDFESKNLILHGAPGTGKTYLTKETIEARKKIENNSEFQLVQFHPSYGYEDFIEGIKPVGLENSQMKFELKNGIFKEMCITAFKNLIESINDKSKLKKYYFIADEINRAELSRVFGELLVCLEDDKRLRINGNKVEGTYVKTQNANLWNDKHIVVRVNENGELSEQGDSFFGVPENIYFIGTMNDIDRSIDSFDMALRRRFVWKNYRCDYDIIETKYNKDTKEEILEDYIDICKNLNTHITIDSGFNLSNSYELGHAYFLKPKKLNKKEIDRVWREHISPILREYLRSEYQHNEIEKKIKEAKDIFTLGKKSATNS